MNKQFGSESQTRTDRVGDRQTDKWDRQKDKPFSF